MAINFSIMHKIFQSYYVSTILLIICKGTKKGTKISPCQFLYDGKWGDKKLVSHQQFHESGDPTIAWLGFDTPQDFGKYSGRDGKRI